MLSLVCGFQSKRVSNRSELSIRSAVRKKLLAPGWFGIGTSPMIPAAKGSMRDAGIWLFAKLSPVTGSRTADVKMPLRSSAVGTRVRRVTPRVMRVPS